MAKIELFDNDLQHVSAIFKVLSHPARLAILKYVAESNTCISGDISEVLPLSRTTVYQHLVALKKMDLISGKIDGVTTCYCLNTKNINNVKSILNRFLTEIDCC